MSRLVRNIATLLLFIVAIGGWSVAGIMSVRTSVTERTEDAALVTRVTDYLTARVTAERNGFSTAPVADFLAGQALADAKALELTDASRPVDGLRLAGDPQVVVLMRSGSTALVQAVLDLADSFGSRTVAEQYLLSVHDNETAWRIDAVFRLADAPAASPAN